jgi:protein-S-isoprenylcysteine O-methyltransferase Ste14
VAWLERMRFVAVLCYSIGCFGLLMGINLYLLIKKKESILGSFNLRKIPQWLRWLPFFGFAGLVFMLLYCATFLFYPAIVDVMLRIPFLSLIPVEIAGAVLMVAGSIFITIGMLQLGPSARFLFPKQKTKLVTTGVFAVARNPVYLGLNSSLIGVFLLLPSLGFLIALIFFLVTNHYRVLEEEDFLVKVFGNEYEDYMRRVGRYGPKLRCGDIPSKGDSGSSDTKRT